MKKLSEKDYYLCRLQAKVFEKSLVECDMSSPIFIKRFMHSDIVKGYDNKGIIYSEIDYKKTFEILKEEYPNTPEGKVKYSPNELYWIGYIYRVISIYYNLSSKAVYKYFPASDIVKAYNIYHTFDPEDAAERLIEAKDISFDYTARGVELLKKYLEEEKLMTK